MPAWSTSRTRRADVARILARTVALRRCLARALEQADWPLATRELSDLVPDALLVKQWQPGQATVWREGPFVYQALRQLENAGLCRRVTDGRELLARFQVDPGLADWFDGRHKFWTWTGDQELQRAIDEMNELDN
jgi:hypothetical protein